MTTAAIRKQLLTYLADADDKKVKAIYTLLESEMTPNEDIKLSEKQLKVLESRRQRHIAGKDQSHKWQDVHDRIRNNRKKAS